MSTFGPSAYNNRGQFFGSSFSSSSAFAIGGASGNQYNSWLMFTGVTIPQGATITSATLTLGTQGFAQAATATLKGSAADTIAAGPTTLAAFVAAARTTASTGFNQGSTTVNVTSQIQEIVNRAGWASGNNLVFYADSTSGTTLFSTWTAGHSLSVTYTVPAAVIPDVNMAPMRGR